MSAHEEMKEEGKFKAEFTYIGDDFIGHIFCDDTAIWFEAMAEIIINMSAITGVCINQILKDVCITINKREKHDEAPRHI